MLKHKLVDFIIQFMEEVDKEISEMKLFVRFPPSSFAHSLVLIPIAAERQGSFHCRVLLDTSKFKHLPIGRNYSRNRAGLRHFLV